MVLRINKKIFKEIDLPVGPEDVFEDLLITLKLMLVITTHDEDVGRLDGGCGAHEFLPKSHGEVIFPTLIRLSIKVQLSSVNEVRHSNAY
jgi:hypothetical protein